VTSPDLQTKDLEKSRELTYAIHYACESWYNVKDRPVAVSCVSIVNIVTRAETTFSMTDTNVENPELDLLVRYFDFLRQMPDARLLHWNMNSSDFGFIAMENRYRYLTSKDPSYVPPRERLFDLDDLIAARFGAKYADHPKLVNMAALNGFVRRYLLSGKEEAERFDRQEHGDIRRSVAEKAQLIAFLGRKFLDGSLETKVSGPTVTFSNARIDAVKVLTTIAQRFIDVARQLRKRHQGRPTVDVKDEYDFQDLYHALLRLFFEDIRPEEWVPSYAGASKRLDFLLPTHRIAVELKHSRANMTAKSLGDELVIDVANYGNHPDVRHLVCLVFDPEGYISNPRGIESDLTTTRQSLRVTVKIIDR